MQDQNWESIETGLEADVWEDGDTFLTADFDDSLAGIFLYGVVETEKGPKKVAVRFWSLKDVLKMTFDIQRAVMDNQQAQGVTVEEFEKTFAEVVEEYLE